MKKTCMAICALIMHIAYGTRSVVLKIEDKSILERFVLLHEMTLDDRLEKANQLKDHCHTSYKFFLNICKKLQEINSLKNGVVPEKYTFIAVPPVKFQTGYSEYDEEVNAWIEKQPHGYLALKFNNSKNNKNIIEKFEDEKIQSHILGVKIEGVTETIKNVLKSYIKKDYEQALEEKKTWEKKEKSRAAFEKLMQFPQEILEKKDDEMDSKYIEEQCINLTLQQSLLDHDNVREDINKEYNPCHD